MAGTMSGASSRICAIRPRADVHPKLLLLDDRPARLCASRVQQVFELVKTYPPLVD